MAFTTLRLLSTTTRRLLRHLTTNNLEDFITRVSREIEETRRRRKPYDMKDVGEWVVKLWVEGSNLVVGNATSDGSKVVPRVVARMVARSVAEIEWTINHGVLHLVMPKTKPPSFEGYTEIKVRKAGGL